MTLARHEKLKEVITTWMLSQMNVNNERRCRTHLTSYTGGMMDVNYDPHKMWVFVNTYHCSITGARLTVITSTLHGPKQSSTDSLTTHLDNFNLVLSEYYKFSGKISETQAACLLISTLLPEYDTMVKIIYMTVKDLTIPKVSLLLLELEVQSGGWANSAVYKISTASAQSCSPSDQPIRRAKCTRAVCIGPHNCQDFLNYLKTPRKRLCGLRSRKQAELLEPKPEVTSVLVFVDSRL